MNNLIKVLTTAKKAIAKNAVFPSIENFYSDGKTIQATNLDLTFKVYHDARFIGGINPDQFIKILDLEPTVIEQKEDKITFSNGSKKVSLFVDLEEFPEGPTVKENIILNDIKTEPFFKSLNFLCKDELRLSMTCFYFGNSQSTKVEICATDAHKLFKHNTQIIQENKFSTLISKKTIEMLKSLKVDTFDMVIGTTESERDYLIINFFACGYLCEVVQKVVDARFPNYSSVIPESNDIEVIYNKKELLAALKNCEKFGNKTSNKFLLEGSRISSEDLDLSCEYSEELSVKGSDTNTRSFNIKWTSEVLNTCNLDEITFKFSQSTSRAAIIEDGDDLFLLMPVMNAY